MYLTINMTIMVLKEILLLGVGVGRFGRFSGQFLVELMMSILVKWPIGHRLTTLYNRCKTAPIMVNQR